MNRKKGREHGEVFTNLDVVHFILNEVGYTENSNLKDVSILEPSAGTGVFATEIINRLIKSSKKFDFDFFEALNNNVSFIELKKETFDQLTYNIKNVIENRGYDSDKIKNNLFYNGNYLEIDSFKKKDCIVGNPPYIRHELIESQAKKRYKQQFRTFKFRADIYILFYEKSLNILSPTGKLSFICSNRWLYNQYGQLLRKKIAKEFHLQKLINIEKSTPFDEAVIAYPCISTITKEKEEFTYYFETKSKEVDFQNIKLRKIIPPQNDSWSNLFLDYNINQDALSSILEQGFKIGIGVATGADKVFIKHSSEINGIEKSRLVPILKSKALKGDEISWDNSYVINPFEGGELCKLDDYPHLKNYLYANKTILEKRHIAKKNPNNWFKTIDKIKLELVRTPKLLLPDLSGSKFLFIDRGNYYPHHNIYYITHEDIDNLKLLACLLMSEFVKNQLSQIGIRMNGGLPRYQSQTLKKLRIPLLKSLNYDTISKLLKSYEEKNMVEINRIVRAYCAQQCIYEA